MLPNRSLFHYDDDFVLALDLPITLPTWRTGAVGGEIEGDSGVRAAYVVRRDNFVDFTLRIFEDEWGEVQLFIDFAQTGASFIWYPDRDDMSVRYECYLEAPAISANYQATPDGTYARVLLLNLTLVLATGTPDVPEPEVPDVTGWVIHQFITGGDFEVVSGSGNAEILIVGGGGSGGSVDGSGVIAGGGGAGGLLHLNAEFLEPGIYPVGIGAGAIAPHADHTIGIGSAHGNSGGGSSFGDFMTHGGGFGAAGIPVPPSVPARHGGDGASGGGGASSWDPFTTAPNNNGGGAAIWGTEGSNGGPGLNADADPAPGGGGGGAGGAGQANGVPGVGLEFATASPTGELYMYAVGGNSHAGPATNGVGYGYGGGGGGGPFCDGGSGAYGVVIVKYRIETGIVAVGGIRNRYVD